MFRLPDGGPVYHETDLDLFFVEPWNAISSLTFLIPVFYLLYKLRGQYREYAFLIFWAAPLMTIGGIGSTLYHAFRASRFFLFMDFVPITILTLSISIYLWNKILPHWIYIILVIAVSFAFRFAVFGYVQGSASINLAYFITGLMIFLPALIFLFQTRFFEVRLLILSVVFLIAALFFRYADDWEHQFFAAGMHWLWHIFTSAGAFTLSLYLIRIKDITIGHNKSA
jgi:predicted membrane channel-forming protein YqfA (hemolysin III family)